MKTDRSALRWVRPPGAGQTSHTTLRRAPAVDPLQVQRAVINRTTTITIFLDDFVLRPHVEIGPQPMAERAFGECGDALGAILGCRQLVGYRPLVEAPLVMGHLDPEHAAAGLAPRCREPADRGP